MRCLYFLCRLCCSWCTCTTSQSNRGFTMTGTSWWSILMCAWRGWQMHSWCICYLSQKSDKPFNCGNLLLTMLLWSLRWWTCTLGCAATDFPYQKIFSCWHPSYLRRHLKQWRRCMLSPSSTASTTLTAQSSSCCRRLIRATDPSKFWRTARP